ncbi:Lysophospholipase L1 [Roseomonas rosea]|uniref:Lysophospholipase L1 n=1 Tax=Muricoccus roseus TaxID=198092 RepID=A0A1M6CLP0_9PROT|nr:GDSL-type esterase/lipase family protein [Roseomonas rosea]SHI61843.1 Lysophospholipase L1 [Roseomonas rosea]
MTRLPLFALLAAQAFLALPVAAAPCGPLPPGTPAITPAPQERERAQRVTERKLAELRAHPAETLLVGDSIIAGWRSAAEDLGRPVTNFGVSADRTENVLARLDRADWAGAPFRRVVVLIGTNNTARDDACAILAGITAIVGRLQEKLPQARIHVVSILPRGPRLAARRRLIEAVNAELAREQGQLRITFVDAFTPFAQSCGEQEECPLLSDRLHPSPAGYAVLARTLRDALGTP